MDVLTVLDKLKDKVLDAAHVDLLRSAYELQQRNVEQLKTNNVALRENIELLKEKLQRSERECSRLESSNAELRRNATTASGRVEYQPSKFALMVLAAFRERDCTNILDEELVERVDAPRLEVETALDELEEHHLLQFGSAGFDGCRYYLTDGGKQFIVRNVPRL